MMHIAHGCAAQVLKRFSLLEDEAAILCKKKQTIKNKMPAGVFMSGTGCKRAGGTCESVIDSVHMSQRRVDMDGCVDMVNQAVCRREGRREGGASTGTQPGGILPVSAPNVCVLFFPTQKNGSGILLSRGD